MRALLIVVLLVGCKSKESPKQPPAPSDASATIDAGVDAAERAAVVVPDTEPARRLWVSRIDDKETFEAYSKEIGNERFAKLVIDLRTDAIYYFDVNVYPVHKDFIFGALYKKPKTKQAVRVFDRNYGANKTDFMMCYLVHHISQDIWTLAFWDGDLANAAHVTRAYKRMKETFFLGPAVKYRPDSNFQEGVAKKLGKDVPFILNDQLYKLAEYTAFNKGTAVGTLRVVREDVPEADLVFAVDEVVILPSTLSDITPVAGIISERFTSPLAHVSLRAKGWGIPNVGLRGAAEKHGDLVGKIVFFEAKDSAYTLRLANDEEIAAAKEKREQATKIEIPKADLVSTELELLETMDKDDERRFGPKSSNLGIIIQAKLTGFTVPAGFGVPFHFYDTHLKVHGIDDKLAAFLADPGDANARKAKLGVLRKAIETAAIDAALCDKVEAALDKLGVAEQGVFVRSSTNAEDLDNFSGAGLHETKPNIKGTKAVCEAIKAVWASTWTLRAYEARAHAGIDQTQVYGSVLVQVAVPATSAGVVATVHPTDPTDEKNYTINAKSGLGIAVVDGRKVPESLIVSWYNHGIRVLSRSDEDTVLVFDDKGGVREIPNPARGKAVLTNKMAIKLADVSRALTKLFGNAKLDIEWVYAGAELFIVQTRPLVGH